MTNLAGYIQRVKNLDQPCTFKLKAINMLTREFPNSVYETPCILVASDGDEISTDDKTMWINLDHLIAHQ